MKTIISVLLAMSLYGCGANKPEISDHEKTCAVLCGALDAAKCWSEPDSTQLFGVYVDLAGCMDKCLSSDGINAEVDVQCLIDSEKCDLGKCVTVVK